MEQKEFYDMDDFKDEEFKDGDLAEPLLLHKIFSTDIMPFLKGGNYPLDCLRVFEFWVGMGFERLLITADNRANRPEQNLQIVYHPDSRDGPPQHIITLRNDTPRWFSDELNRRKHTQNFSYATTINP